MPEAKQQMNDTNAQSIHTELLGAEHVTQGSDPHRFSSFAFDNTGDAMPCAVSVASSGSPFVLRIHGEMDLYTLPFLKEHIHRAMKIAATPNLILDFSYCDFVDSTGLALMLKVNEDLKQLGGSLCLANTSPHLRQKFSRTFPTGTITMIP